VTIKNKLLDALDITLEDVSEERLIDLLLDAYKVKERRIEVLEGENAHEREDMHHEREKMREEYRRMRSDPLYWREGGVYYFRDYTKCHTVLIQGGQVRLMERIKDVDIAVPQVKQEEWLR
jgi:hypothetical protein